MLEGKIDRIRRSAIKVKLDLQVGEDPLDDLAYGLTIPAGKVVDPADKVEDVGWLLACRRLQDLKCFPPPQNHFSKDRSVFRLCCFHFFRSPRSSPGAFNPPLSVLGVATQGEGTRGPQRSAITKPSSFRFP